MSLGALPIEIFDVIISGVTVSVLLSVIIVLTRPSVSISSLILPMSYFAIYMSSTFTELDEY